MSSGNKHPAEAASEAVLAIEPRADEIRRASIWARNHCEAFGIPNQALERLELCLNEVLANVLSYGSGTVQTRPIEIRLRLEGHVVGGTAVLEVHDAGVAFDPAAYIPKKLSNSLGEVEVGGLGLTLIRHNASTLSYKRSEGINVLKLGFEWPHLSDDGPG